MEPFLKTDRLSDSEREMLMGGACAKAYRWSPKKAPGFIALPPQAQKFSSLSISHFWHLADIAA